MRANLCRYPTLDGQRSTELADQLQIKKQFINDVLRHLEQSGYLVRKIDPADTANDAIPGSRRPDHGGVMPKSYILASKVADFIGAPLSECSTRESRRHFSLRTLRCNKAAASSPDSARWTSHPTALRL
ncbi:MAG: MarR family transcriptional regulator [Marinobacter psychrophilus]|nr:MarR family transcriptional regulator [Marinobacter psychrophilus]